MKSFFEAKNIAVIGASRSPEKVGHVVFENLYANPRLKIFPVNPNAYDISGVKAYPDVLHVPFRVDMAVIATPAETVPEILDGCGRKGVKDVIIISSGFAESGNIELDTKVKETANKYGIKIIGPNVLGIINPYTGINASFFREMPQRGKIAFISQSGAVGSSILDKALLDKMGFSGFISLGNMVNQGFISALEYFGNDNHTEIILLYIESLQENTGKDFVEMCKKISRKKKIIAINAGKTQQGIRAAKTHTAALSSPAKIYSGAFRQGNVIEVDSLNEMFLLARIFSRYGKIGKKAGIITNAGGLGVLAVDSCVSSGIEIPEIPGRVLNELDSFMPDGYSRGNPLDILGDALADRYEKVLKLMARREVFDFFIVIISPQEMTQPLETARVLIQRGTPIFPCFVGGKSFENVKKQLREHGIITFDDVSELGKILGKVIS